MERDILDLFPIKQDDSDGKAIIKQADHVFRQELSHIIH